jgi:glycine dehydrogenase subunit 1
VSYVPITPAEREAMCRELGIDEPAELWSSIPEALRLGRSLDLPAPLSEVELRREMTRRAEENLHLDRAISFLGGGMADHFVPSVVGELVRRSEFYTAYTPYQPEVAQGTLQATYEYQTMIARLTGMEVSNASVHDGATAMTEAALMAAGATGRSRVLVSTSVAARYREVLATHASGGALEVVEIPHVLGKSDHEAIARELGPEVAAVIVARPNAFGIVEELEELPARCQEAGALLVVVTEAISLALLESPGALGADLVVGDGQPLGNALSFGGPTFGFLACRRQHVRRLPGRLVGRTRDADGDPAYVLTLQTREQHIRRERATSNICTSSSLNALTGAIYLAVMGREGFREVAWQCLQKSHYAARRLAAIPRVTLAFAEPFVKEFVVRVEGSPEEILGELARDGFLAGPALARDYPELHRHFTVCVTENRTRAEIDDFAARLANCLRERPSPAVV